MTARANLKARASQRPNPNQSPKRDKAPHPVLPQLIHLPRKISLFVD